MSMPITLTDELRKRMKTALAGVSAILLLLAFGGTLGAVLIATAISLGMIYEFTEITLTLPDKKEKRFAMLGCAWLLQFTNFWLAGGEFALVAFFFLGFAAFFLVTAERYNDNDLKTHYVELMYCVFGFIYLGFLPTYLVSLRQSAYGAHWSILFLLIIWANDVGAYFAGQKYGKKRLYPHISPKKSWEGAYGGAAAALLVTILFKLTVFKALSWLGMMVIPLVLSVSGPVGDLAESFLKRAFDKKDSSSLLPGHGGFLDRFDSVVFSLPVMVALTRIFGAV